MLLLINQLFLKHVRLPLSITQLIISSRSFIHNSTKYLNVKLCSFRLASHCTQTRTQTHHSEIYKICKISEILDLGVQRKDISPSPKNNRRVWNLVTNLSDKQSLVSVNLGVTHCSYYSANPKKGGFNQSERRSHKSSSQKMESRRLVRTIVLPRFELGQKLGQVASGITTHVHYSGAQRGARVNLHKIIYLISSQLNLVH
jgi:hypothetical protein